MKKTNVLLFLAASVLSLTSCSGGGASSTSQKQSSETPTSIPPVSSDSSISETSLSSSESSEEEVAVTGIQFEQETLTLEVGKDAKLPFKVLPENATNKAVYIETSNTKVTKINGESILAKTGGSAEIKVTTVDGGFSATIAINVPMKSVDPVSILLSKENAKLSLGEELKLQTEVLPTEATAKTVSWASDNEEVASVVDGLVTAKAVGNANITATASGGKVTATCAITVEDISDAFEFGSMSATPSKSFKYNGNGVFEIEKYDELGYAYAKYTGVTSKNWYMEATVFDVDSNMSDSDIHNKVAEWWTPPVGIAGVNDIGINTFGALSYSQFNAFDNYLFLKSGNPTGVSGTYVNFGRNLGGTETAAMIDFKNGFKVGVIHDGDVFFYLINDVYVGYNNKWMGDNMWEDDSPALVTYKSGAKFKNIHVYTGEEYTAQTSSFYQNYDRMQGMFAAAYTNDYIRDQADYKNESGEPKLYLDTKEGGLYLTGDGQNCTIRSTYSGNKWYFAFDISIEHLASWVSTGNYPWVGIGAGHVGDYESEHRAMAPVPIYNQPGKNVYDTKTIDYIATPVSWTWQTLHIDDDLAEALRTREYKCAVLRDQGMVYYYINDQLILSDNNTWNMGWDTTNPTTPIIYNAWGGTARVSNIELITNASEVDAKRESLTKAPDMPTPSNAKVIIMCGQSNMEGYTPMSDLDDNTRGFMLTDSKRIQIDCVNRANNNNTNGFRYVNWGMGCNSANFGPEIGLSKTLADDDPDTNYYLIKYALGGSNLFDQWRSPSRGTPGELYSGMMNRVAELIEYFNNNEVNFEIEGFCWMQGEADACAESTALSYYTNLYALYEDLEDDLSDYLGEGGLKFIDAGISTTWAYYQIVNEAKAALEEELPNYTFIDTIDEGLEVRSVDAAHYDGISQYTLGTLFGENFLKAIGR